MNKRIASLAAVVIISFGSWKALAFGNIVHDPISYANALLILAEIIRNHEQLKDQYDLQVWNSTTIPVDMSSVYRVPGTPWYGLQVPTDRFGKLALWLQAVNSAGSAWDGYSSAAVPLAEAGSNVAKLNFEEQEKLARRYASVELADGTNIHTMETLGAMRMNAIAADSSLQALEDDSLSLAPEMNTEVGVLNKINAGTVAALRLNRDTNRLLLSAVEQQLAESKVRRDAETSELNVQMMRLQYGDEAKAEHSRTLGESLRSFRWR